MNCLNLILMVSFLICSIFLLIAGRALSKVENHQDMPSFLTPLRTFKQKNCENKKDSCPLENEIPPHEIIKFESNGANHMYELNGIRHEIEVKKAISALNDENVCRRMRGISLQKDSKNWIRRMTTGICNFNFCNHKDNSVEFIADCLEKKQMELEKEWEKLFEEEHN